MELLNQFIKFSKGFKELYAKTDPRILELEGISIKQLDVTCMSDRYFKERVTDMSIDDNANHLQDGRSYGNYFAEMAKSGLKIVGYHDIYKILEKEHGKDRANDILTSLWNGDLYFHDSTAVQIPYCWAYSTAFLLFKGNFWGQLRSFAPKRARSFIDQVKEVTIEIAQEIAGAVAISDLIVCYSYYIKKDNLDLNDLMVRKEIENDFQSLIHTLNKKLRSSHQSPFTNISIFDNPNLKVLFGDMRFPDGSAPDFDIVMELQKIFCNWFYKGDPSNGLPYRFPVVTLNLRVDEKGNIIDKESFEYFSRINLDKGCFNIYISSGNKIASCCRLTNDLDLAGIDSFGNGGISLGSHRVVTINLARIGKISKSYEQVIDLLKVQLEKAKDSLLAHRKLLTNRLDFGFLPFFKYGIMHMNRMFSTFGVNGVYECLEELGYSILTSKGKQIASDILEVIRSYSRECSIKYKCPFNIEQVPAESLAIKFAAKDKLLYGMDYPIYANQFIPLWVECDIVERIKLDGVFSKILTGGGISHLNVGEKLTSPEQMKKLIVYAIKSGCEHFAINYNFCKCKNDHITISGPSTKCSICGDKIVEQYTRIIGYLTPVSAWNKGRQKEHKKRIFKNETFENGMSNVKINHQSNFHRNDEKRGVERSGV
ncbi:anaerobic ribonucleoside-triphosphate reductase [Candidatus Babeliales bacterium]|nr:anaerobic ribonucleoside-triphosphate reductase [Candidatus Babeliales bacterium]